MPREQVQPTEAEGGVDVPFQSKLEVAGVLAVPGSEELAVQIANLPEDNRVISLKVAGVIDEAAPDGEAVEVLEGGWDGLCGVHAASVGTDRAENATMLALQATG